MKIKRPFINFWVNIRDFDFWYFVVDGVCDWFLCCAGVLFFGIVFDNLVIAFLFVFIYYFIKYIWGIKD